MPKSQWKRRPSSDAIHPSALLVPGGTGDQRPRLRVPMQRLLLTTGVLWLIAGISIGSVTTKIMLSASSYSVKRSDISSGDGDSTGSFLAAALDLPSKLSVGSGYGRQLGQLSAGNYNTRKVRPLYHEIQDQVNKVIHQWKTTGKLEDKPMLISDSNYNRATVVRKAPWLPPRKQCRKTCCVQTVAISLAQTSQQIIHCRDGMDLADIQVFHSPSSLKRTPHLQFHASSLTLEILPCLVPGTIIQVDNHVGSLIYFWKHLRPHIEVPFVLLTTGSDADSPQIKPMHIQDPLMKYWYGNNPHFPPHLYNKQQFMNSTCKFRPLNLGLSGFNHPHQEQHMLPYLQLTHFENPFLDKQRWDFQKQPFSFAKDVFVHFGTNKDHRKRLWKVLCPSIMNALSQSASCDSNTEDLPISKIYASMSHYRFGVSPTGEGWDCYRTYEMLLLGVIPIVEDRGEVSRQLFSGLPVIFMPNMRTATSKQPFIDAIHSYMDSGAFQETDFTQGWKKLFLQHTQQQLLQDTDRIQDIVVDEQGQQYYQAFQYSVIGPNAEEKNQRIFCEPKGNCLNQEERQTIPDYIIKKEDWFLQPAPVLQGEDKRWVEQWESSR